MARPDGATAAVVFLHGLDGHYWRTWGTDENPGTFIRRTIEDLPQLAVAAFDYPARLFGFLDENALTIDEISQAWAESLRETILGKYSTVAIVGYCLGGIVTTLALRRLLSSRALPPCRILAFLLDVPHDWPECYLTTGEVLKVEVATLHANAEFWRAQQQLRNGLSAYAVLSRGDSWTSSFNPAGRLPPDRICSVAVTHVQLTKPPVRGFFKPFDFVVREIRRQGVCNPPF